MHKIKVLWMEGTDESWKNPHNAHHTHERAHMAQLDHWILEPPFFNKGACSGDVCCFPLSWKAKLHWGMDLASNHTFSMQITIFPFINFLMIRHSLFPSNWFHLCSLSAKYIHLGLKIMMPWIENLSFRLQSERYSTRNKWPFKCYHI